MNKHNLFLLSVCLTFSYYGWAQNNFLDTSTWGLSTGSAPGFNRLGSDAENVREMGVDPFGNSSVLWKAVPDAQNNGDGGWDSNYIEIDPTKNYRFTVWIKKTNSNDGVTLFGFYALDPSEARSSYNLDGTAQTNPYFLWGDLPQLDQWYLLVGYAYHENHTETVNQGGIYDVNGIKVSSLNDFRFYNSTKWLVHRNYLYYNTNTNDQQFFWNPTVYEVNGQEPSLQDLIQAPSNGSGNAIWSETNSVASYDGKVQVGNTQVPSDYMMAVSGKLIAEEVKVQLSGDWPDYVFTEEYTLPTLEAVRMHIQEKGHLPNMPSAKEVAKNGVELGEMNKLLLEKIEELTLYILKQDKALQHQSYINQSLEKRLAKVERFLKE
ncbi:MAG: hypothetical protein AAGF77_07880 [Bacteroidota bacterium]